MSMFIFFWTYEDLEFLGLKGDVRGLWMEVSVECHAFWHTSGGGYASWQSLKWLAQGLTFGTTLIITSS